MKTNLFNKDDALNMIAIPQNENKKMGLGSASLIGSGAIVPNPKSINYNEEVKVQVWKSASDVINNKLIPISYVVKSIAKSETNSKIIKLRELYYRYLETGDLNFKKEYDRLKISLPLITFSAYFNNRRDEEHLICFNGLRVLDIDGKENPDLSIRIESLRRNLIDCPYTRLLFNSPSGNGLKIVVNAYLNEEIINCNNELMICLDTKRRKELFDTINNFHFNSHKQIRDYYSEKYDIVIDSNAKNYQGVCFWSADRNVYYNSNSSSFKVIWSKKEKETTTFNTCNNFNFSTTSNNDILEAILKDFTKNCSGRNTATFAIALQAKHYNISENEILNFVMNKWGDYDFDEKEALRAIRNGFKYTPYVQYIFNNNNSNNL